MVPALRVQLVCACALPAAVLIQAFNLLDSQACRVRGK